MIRDHINPLSTHLSVLPHSALLVLFNTICHRANQREHQQPFGLVSGGCFLLVHLHGDIVAILDSNGNKVVEYKYDAWGRPISKTGSMATSLGELNPFRYRGYVYDEETGVYYLRSRYYSPGWPRFLNADALTKGNLFAYCSNNPINFHDPDGYEQIASVEDLYRLIAEQAVLEGGVPASEFLSRSNEVMNVGKPYKNTMEPERGFVCSGYFLYYLGYTRDYGSSSAFRKLSSAVGYIEDIGWENLPTSIILGQMYYNSSGKPVSGNEPFSPNDIARDTRKYVVKHTGILRDIYYENGQIMFVVSQFTPSRIGTNGESGGITRAFTLKEMKDHHWNVWMYPQRLREDRCIPLPWKE